LPEKKKVSVGTLSTFHHPLAPPSPTPSPAFKSLGPLAHQLIVKRVVQLPSLVQDSEKTVDFALDAAKDTLPPLLDYLFTAQRREADVDHLQVQVKTEKGVNSF
jgi:hypothetical protein